jgi:hypothetical protein
MGNGCKEVTYGLRVNDNPTIWLEDALFLIVSLVAGREQSVASLSVSGRALTGMNQTWMNATLAIGDQLIILRRAAHPSSNGSRSRLAVPIPESGSGKVSGFALNIEGEESTLVEISRHELVQAIGTWDATSNIFKLSLNAVTSNAGGTIDDNDGLLLEQASEVFRSIHIRIV